MAHDRYTPHRSNSRKDSWLTVDWGERGPPSAVQAVMDQIAGFIVRDPKLIDQGRREWRKAAAIRRDNKRRRARGETVQRNPSTKSTSKGSSTGTKKVSSAAAKAKATGFLSSFLGKKKPVRSTSSGAIRRALTKPGQHRSNSTPVPVAHRSTPARQSSHPVGRHQSTRNPSAHQRSARPLR